MLHLVRPSVCLSVCLSVRLCVGPGGCAKYERSCLSAETSNALTTDNTNSARHFVVGLLCWEVERTKGA